MAENSNLMERASARSTRQLVFWAARIFSRLVLGSTILLLLSLAILGVSELSQAGLALLFLATGVLAWHGGRRAWPYLSPLLSRVPVRFSLRSLIIATLAGGIGMAWCGNWLRAIRVQRQALDQLGARGYMFTFDGDPWAGWAYEQFGMSGVIAVGGIETIALEDREVEAADLIAMERLHFQGLYLLRCTVTDDQVLLMRPNSHLRHFEAPGCPLGDRTLAHLSKFEKLETIDLHSTTLITDDGIAPLQQLAYLKVLSVPRTPLTDKSIGQLKAMKQLETLAVSRTAITPAGIQELRRALPNCTIVY